MHLLYARFFTKAMSDLGMVHEREPFKRLFNQGQILGADGERMSKSRGNVEDPDALVAYHGADTVRLFLMFMGPWDQGGPWNAKGIGGVSRFLNRVWAVALDPHGVDPGDAESGQLPAGQGREEAEKALRAATHRTLRTVSEEYAELRFNTMVAHLMELSNLLQRYRGTVIAGTKAWDEAVRLTLLMLAPAAPHVTEELWSRMAEARGEAWSSIHSQPWPEVDVAAATENEREVPIQVNGKVRDKVMVPVAMAQAELEALVLARPKIVAALDGKLPLKVIHAGGKLVNIVVR
jgi:leucyl-tRNA synthetase